MEGLGKSPFPRQWLESMIGQVAEGQEGERPDLGRRLYAWTYKPTAARKRKAIVIMLIVLAVAVLVFYLARSYGKTRLLISMFESGMYGVVGYLVKRVWDAYQSRYYELYEGGIVVAKSAERGPSDQNVFRWKRFKSCNLVAAGVQLKPVKWHDLETTLYVSGPERLTVYNICVEMISRVRSQSVSGLKRSYGASTGS